MSESKASKDDDLESIKDKSAKDKDKLKMKVLKDALRTMSAEHEKLKVDFAKINE
jgi:hypothetical protein